MPDTVRCIKDNHSLLCNRMGPSGKDKETFEDVLLVRVKDSATDVSIYQDGRAGFQIPSNYVCKNEYDILRCFKKR